MGAFSTKGMVRAVAEQMLATGGHSHEAIAAECRRRVAGAQTTARSVASVAVDYRRAGGATPRAAGSRRPGRVKDIVGRMLAKGDRTHEWIAQVVRRCEPEARTTARSVASMAVDWRREHGAAAAAQLAEARG